MKYRTIIELVALVGFVILARVTNKASYQHGRLEGASEIIDEFEQRTDSLQSLYRQAKDLYLERCEAIATYEIYREAMVYKDSVYSKENRNEE